MVTKDVITIGEPSAGRYSLSYLTKLKNELTATEIINNDLNRLNEPKTFIIKRAPVLPEIFIDPKEPIFNEVKHRQTCAKNRKKRKKRKRK
tara:strand:- start:4103 stop:4375 length:273 start_codon:yes stop_codon:yes gene_type:complete